MVNLAYYRRCELSRVRVLENYYGYLLDGQQQLTALSRVRDGDEEYPLMFCTWPKREEEGDDTFVWQAKWNTTTTGTSMPKSLSKWSANVRGN